jgi:hypothetical protein
MIQKNTGEQLSTVSPILGGTHGDIPQPLIFTRTLAAHGTVLASGATISAVGSANPIDIGHRELGRTVWAEESITEAALVDLGHDHFDLFLGHDAPPHDPTLYADLAETERCWPAVGLKYAPSGARS